MFSLSSLCMCAYCSLFDCFCITATQKASMRVLLILSSLVFFALLALVFIQNTAMVSLNDKNAQLKIQLEELDIQYKNKAFHKTTTETMFAMGTELVKNTEQKVARLLLKLEKKKTENDTCQTEKVIYLFILFMFCFLAASAFLLLKNQTKQFKKPHMIKCNCFSFYILLMQKHVTILIMQSQHFLVFHLTWQ